MKLRFASCRNVSRHTWKYSHSRKTDGPEFGSALGLKERTSQIDKAQAQAAWVRFERLVANDLRLLPVDVVDVHRAALLTRDAASGIRAGDALHLACAERSGATSLVTLDAVMARNAQRVKLKVVALAA